MKKIKCKILAIAFAFASVVCIWVGCIKSAEAGPQPPVITIYESETVTIRFKSKVIDKKAGNEKIIRFRSGRVTENDIRFRGMKKGETNLTVVTEGSASPTVYHVKVLPGTDAMEMKYVSAFTEKEGGKTVYCYLYSITNKTDISFDQMDTTASYGKIKSHDDRKFMPGSGFLPHGESYGVISFDSKINPKKVHFESRAYGHIRRTGFYGTQVDLVPREMISITNSPVKQIGDKWGCLFTIKNNYSKDVSVFLNYFSLDNNNRVCGFGNYANNNTHHKTETVVLKPNEQKNIKGLFKTKKIDYKWIATEKIKDYN